MSPDEVLQPQSQLKFMDIYFEYINEVGGGQEWAFVHREYADVQIRSIMLHFAKELIYKGKYANSETKKMMDEYDYTLPEGHEIAMIDSYLASLQLDIDHISKRMRDLNKAEGKGATLVQLLTQITNANGLYLPYNSVLLIEFIEQYKLLKQKSIKNGRPNK